jgi:hypothetical protein
MSTTIGRYPVLGEASYGNVVLSCGVGSHAGWRGLPGGAEGIRTPDLCSAGARALDGRPLPVQSSRFHAVIR